MTRKTLGFTELHWECPFCSTVNVGTSRFCSNCGAPQPADVEFFEPPEAELITDEAQLEALAEQAPDIHCAYCGSRNAADNQFCTQCGAELAEGAARQAGRVIGAHGQEGPESVVCPSCSFPNSPTARHCQQCYTPLRQAYKKQVKEATAKAKPAGPTARSKPIGLYIIGGIVLLFVLFIFFMTRTSEVVGEVQAVEWTRSIAILGPTLVEYDEWQDEIPRGAEVLSCSERVRDVRPQPVAGRRSVEVCGTPYTIDRGTGVGEVVQDCQYEIYDNFCEYQVEELRPVDEVVVGGADFQPFWPTELNLQPGQQLGEREERFEVTFRADGETYTYVTDDPGIFATVQQSDRWILNVNPLGGVQSIAPDR